MENLKTEVIQLSDSDDEIPVLVKRELCATPSLKAPEIQEPNEEKNTRNSGSEKEFTKFIEFKRNEIDLKKFKAEHQDEIERLKHAHQSDIQKKHQNFENKFEACKRYYQNKMESQRGIEKAQVAKEHSLLETLNQVLQQRLKEKEAEIERQKDEINLLKLEKAGIYPDTSLKQPNYFFFPHVSEMLRSFNKPNKSVTNGLKNSQTSSTMPNRRQKNKEDWITADYVANYGFTATTERVGPSSMIGTDQGIPEKGQGTTINNERKRRRNQRFSNILPNMTGKFRKSDYCKTIDKF